MEPDAPTTPRKWGSDTAAADCPVVRRLGGRVVTESLVIKCAHGHRAEAGEIAYAELEAENKRLRGILRTVGDAALERGTAYMAEYDLANKLAARLANVGHEPDCFTVVDLGAEPDECDCDLAAVLAEYHEARK